MNKTKAHQILNQVRQGISVSAVLVTLALITTGDLC